MGARGSMLGYLIYQLVTLRASVCLSVCLFRLSFEVGTETSFFSIVVHLEYQGHWVKVQGHLTENVNFATWTSVKFSLSCLRSRS